jgi:hypothetical protein
MLVVTLDSRRYAAESSPRSLVDRAAVLEIAAQSD